MFDLTIELCVWTPGMVPLPDTAIDFSDLRSQSSRMNERVSHIQKNKRTLSQQRLRSSRQG